MSSKASTGETPRRLVISAYTHDDVATTDAGSSITFEREGQFWKADLVARDPRIGVMVTLQRFTNAQYGERDGPPRAYVLSSGSIIRAVIEDHFSGALPRQPESGS